MIRYSFWPDWYIEDEKADLIGMGSFGRVYRIRREDLGMQTVSALKVIRVPAEPEEVEELRERGMDDRSITAYYDRTARDITEEIRLLLTLRACPNIIAIEDYHLEPNEDGFGFTMYIRMPLLKSLEQTVRADMKAGRRFSVREVVKIGVDICDALIACETRNIIHRDIKPANIYMDEPGTFILGDFGIARQLDSVTRSMHSQIGTLNYMAPEILRGDTGYDHTVDIYSLGTMLYRFLNHYRFPYETPWPGPVTPEDTGRILSMRRQGAPVPLPDQAPEALGRVLQKACAPDPSDRYRRAADLKKALQQAEAAGGEPQASAEVRLGGTMSGQAPAFAQTPEEPTVDPGRKDPFYGEPGEATFAAFEGGIPFKEEETAYPGGERTGKAGQKPPRQDRHKEAPPREDPPRAEQPRRETGQKEAAKKPDSSGAAGQKPAGTGEQKAGPGPSAEKASSHPVIVSFSGPQRVADTPVPAPRTMGDRILWETIINILTTAGIMAGVSVFLPFLIPILVFLAVPVFLCLETYGVTGLKKDQKIGQSLQAAREGNIIRCSWETDDKKRQWAVALNGKWMACGELKTPIYLDASGPAKGQAVVVLAQITVGLDNEKARQVIVNWLGEVRV